MFALCIISLANRSVILMWITILMGGTYCMENPLNSLVACHPRYVWMLEQLRVIGVYVPRLSNKDGRAGRSMLDQTLYQHFHLIIKMWYPDKV